MDMSTIGKRSKRKGKKYESRVALILSELTGAKFRRIPCSGGFNKTGGSVILEHVFSGDVVCEDQQFAFSIEAKNRKDISLTALLKNPQTASITKYWKQCVDDARANGLMPMMFFKPNSADDWVCISIDDALNIGVHRSNHIELKTFNSIELPPMFVVEWHEFKRHIQPEKLFR